MSTINESKHHIVDPKYLLTFILVTTLFFLWAMPNNLNDILIAQFMKSFELNRLQAGLVQSAFYLGYFLLAIPAALVMQRFGYKAGLITGLVFFATGSFLFYPAALSGEYYFFLGSLFVIACGLAFLETGANSFIAVLGDPETSERRLNLAQAFNPIGAMTGVIIGTVFIFSGTELTDAKVEAMKLAGTYQNYLKEETLRVGPPYIVIGCVVLVIAFLMLKAKFPKNESEDGQSESGTLSALLKYPHWYKGVMAQFFYVGAQVGTWSFFIQYVKDNTGLSEKIAGGFLTGTLGAFMIGRFGATFLMKYIKSGHLMGLFSIANILLVSIGILFPGWIGVWSIFLTSFFMSLMFPTIFALGVKGLGPNTKLGGSFIIMAIIGGAVWTPIMGLIADKTGSMAMAMIIPLISYFFILYYSYKGSKPSGPLHEGENHKIVVSH